MWVRAACAFRAAPRRSWAGTCSFLQSQVSGIGRSGDGNEGWERLGFSAGSPGTCLGIPVLFVTIPKRRGELLREEKLGHLHGDVMVASRKKRAVPLCGFGQGHGYHQRKAFVILWEHLLDVPVSPFLSDWFFSSSFAPCSAQTFSPNREIR